MSRQWAAHGPAPLNEQKAASCPPGRSSAHVQEVSARPERPSLQPGRHADSLDDKSHPGREESTSAAWVFSHDRRRGFDSCLEALLMNPHPTQGFQRCKQESASCSAAFALLKHQSNQSPPRQPLPQQPSLPLVLTQLLRALPSTVHGLVRARRSGRGEPIKLSLGWLMVGSVSILPSFLPSLHRCLLCAAEQQPENAERLFSLLT